AGSDADRLLQLAAVLAVGGHAVWPASAATLHATLPPAVQERTVLVADWQAPAVVLDAVLHHGTPEGLRDVCRAVAARPGPIVGVSGHAPGDANVALERLVAERAVSINTAAAGGNASLMTMD
ncbi:hypothetical protein L7Q18_32830, partial [Achromobacter xylosoxidans]|uniref:hypothetical protein n=1 Tax=Alcaligenes xylosoxydans xylosoxydans TaxID=85698 RepID=UPI001F05FB33